MVVLPHVIEVVVISSIIALLILSVIKMVFQRLLKNRSAHQSQVRSEGQGASGNQKMPR